jgi:hypothetical protein
MTSASSAIAYSLPLGLSPGFLRMIEAATSGAVNGKPSLKMAEQRPPAPGMFQFGTLRPAECSRPATLDLNLI